MSAEEKSPRVDLSGVATSALRAELARRELAAEVVRCEPAKWVCAACSNVVVGGGDGSSAYAMAGRVWCRRCDPSGRPNYYGGQGRPASVPMKQVAP